MTYLSSNSTPYIIAGLYALRQYTIEANILELEDIIIKSQLAQFLCFRLEIHSKLHEKEDYSIVFEILWIFINLLATEPKRPDEYLHQLVTPARLQCIELLLDNQYTSIVDNTIWMLISLISMNKKYKLAVLNSKVVKKCIYLTTKSPIEVLQLRHLLEFIIQMIKDIDAEKYKDLIGSALTVFQNELFHVSSPECFSLGIKGISKISNLDDLPKDISNRIINDGSAIKILRTDLSSNKNNLYYALHILFNLLAMNDKVIEILLQLRVMDYYEIHLNKYMNDVDITPLIIGGMENIAEGRDEYKKVIISSILFEEKEKKYLALLYSNISYIRTEMINLIEILSLSKNEDILEFLNEKGIIHEILLLAIDERLRKNFFNKYTNIISSFLLNYHKANLQKKAKYIYVFEKYQELLNSMNPLITEKDREKLRYIINETNVNNSYN